MIVEIHFQMNYTSGEWKTIKKFIRLEDSSKFFIQVLSQNQQTKDTNTITILQKDIDKI